MKNLPVLLLLMKLKFNIFSIMKYYAHNNVEREGERNGGVQRRERKTFTFHT